MIPYKVEALEDAQNLVRVCDRYDFDIDAICGIQTVNAKSILGVTSLLGRFISLAPQTNNKELVTKFENDVREYSHCY